MSGHTPWSKIRRGHADNCTLPADHDGPCDGDVTAGTWAGMSGHADTIREALLGDPPTTTYRMQQHDALRQLDALLAESQQTKRVARNSAKANAELRAENQRLREDKHHEYIRGLLEGIRRFSYTSSQPWAEPGVHYVGTTGKTLREAEREALAGDEE